MQHAESDRSVGQVINWYLAWALKGKHSPTGEAKSQSTIMVQRSLAQFHIDQSVLSRKFVELTPHDIQSVIDHAASIGSEPAALGLKKLFTDLDKFAVRQSVLDKVRTHNCSAPQRLRPPRLLTNRQFKDAWDGYLLCGRGGSVIMRGPCLAILVSAVTLQPLQRVVGMRREEIDFERSLWIAPIADGAGFHHAPLSGLAIDLIHLSFEFGDFVHRSVPTPFVFPSAGPKRDPMRPIGFTSTFEVTDQLFPKADIKPTDLAHTGSETLKAMGGESFKSLVATLMTGCSEIPASEQVLVADAWADRVGQFGCKTFAAI